MRGLARGAWFAVTVMMAAPMAGQPRAQPSAASDTTGPTANAEPLSLPAQVGKKIFFDQSLSGSGTMSCATCHDPAHAYAAPDNLAVQYGGPTRADPGTRTVPSLRYKDFTPPYADLADNPDGISIPGPGGGFTRDGRAQSLAAQAQIPLLAANEMANGSADEVVAKLARASYAELFRNAFGAGIFTSSATAFQRALDALQAYQLEDESFRPYTSKYDLFANNKIGGDLTESEARGLAVFDAPDKGNCFACHYSGPGIGGSVGLFTDFTFAAIGVPRNGEIPANRDPSYFDMGICSRTDHPLPAAAKYCGMYKTPTLRNVAARKVFFHNGKMKSLAEVLRFYNTRDTDPARWYPNVNGVVEKFDDLPAAYRGNIDTQAPLDGRAIGSPAPMSDQDLVDLEAFLNTLTDKDVLDQANNPSTNSPVVPALGTSLAFLLALTLIGVATTAWLRMSSPKPKPDDLQTALATFLEQRGDLCLGKSSWPIFVSTDEARSQTYNAQQMPVLERLGVVRAVPVRSDAQNGQASGTNYQLTPLGQRSSVSRGSRSGNSHPRAQPDLCAGKLVLDKVVSVEQQARDGGDGASRQALVRYTYHFAAVAWMRDPQAQHVFPMVAKLMAGAGTLALEQRFTRSGAEWIALDPTL